MNLVLTFVTVLTTIQASSDHSKWREFKDKHEKEYSVEEETSRFDIFRKNLRVIEEHNTRFQNGNETHLLTANVFADWSAEEFEAWLTIKPEDGSEAEKNHRKTFDYDSHEGIPETVDWREKNAVRTVKYQGRCSACWAYSVLGSIEGQLAIHRNQYITLSEQELIDCDDHGCRGNSVENGFKYMKENNVSTAEQYPYSGHSHACKRQTISDRPFDTIKKFVHVPETEEALAQALAIKGPISVSVHANPWMFVHGDRIVDFGNCRNGRINHSVVLVGFGTEDGKDYWILKNSWGVHWGDKGYLKLARGTNQCKIREKAFYPEL